MAMHKGMHSAGLRRLQRQACSLAPSLPSRSAVAGVRAGLSRKPSGRPSRRAMLGAAAN